MKRFITKIGLILISLLIGLSPLMNAMPIEAYDEYSYEPDSANANKYYGNADKQTWANHYSLENATNSAYGTLLLTGNDASVDNYQGLYVSIIGFQVGTLPSGIITSAKIRIYVTTCTNNWNGTSPSAAFYHAHPSTFPTANADWNNAQGIAASTSSKTFASMADVGWYEFAIASPHFSEIVPDSNGYVWYYLMDNYYATNIAPTPPEDTYRSYMMDAGGYGGSPPQLVLQIDSDITPLAVTTEAATSVTSTTATLNGNITSLGGESSVRGCFEYGLTTAYGSYTGWDDYNSTTTYSVGITTFGGEPLIANTTYHYRAFIFNSPDNINGADMEFTTSVPTITPEPPAEGLAPIVLTKYSSPVNNSTVCLRGAVPFVGSTGSAVVGFDLGTNTTVYTNYESYFSPMNITANWYTEITDPGTTGNYYLSLGGMTYGTTYYYRATASNIYGNVTGSWVSYVQGSPSITVINPIILTLDATNITATGPDNYHAQLNGNLASIGSYPDVKVGFVIREGTSGAWSDTALYQWMNATGEFNGTTTISLKENTTYQYMAFGWNGYNSYYTPELNGAPTVYGDVKSFFTGSGWSPPSFNVLLSPATGISKTSATISAILSGMAVNDTANVIFSYGPGDYYALGKHIDYSPNIPVTNNGTATFALNGLTPGTTYWFSASASVGITSRQSSPNHLTFNTITNEGSTPGVTPTPTATPPSTDTIGPFHLPDDWVTGGTSYVYLVILLIAVPAALIFMFAATGLIKMGAVLGGLADVGVFSYWVIKGWFDVTLLIILTIAVIVLLWKTVFSARSA